MRKRTTMEDLVENSQCRCCKNRNANVDLTMIISIVKNVDIIIVEEEEVKTRK